MLVAENALAMVDDASITAAPRVVLTKVEETIRNFLVSRNDPEKPV